MATDRTRAEPGIGYRRLWWILAAGAAAGCVGLAVRLVATSSLARWQAGRLSDSALARAAAARDAAYPTVFEHARRLERDARFAEAAREYRRSADLDPVAVEAWLGWGRAAYAGGDWRQADPILRKTAEQWPRNAEGHFLYAALLASTLRPRAAAEQLRAGLKQQPAQSQAWRRLGDLELSLGNAAAAVEAYQRARDCDPKPADLRAVLGAALARAGRMDEARVELEIALRADPSDLETRFHLGETLEATRRPEDHARAIQEFNRVVGFSSGAPKSRAYLHTARIWLKDGNRADAIQALEHAVDLDPYNLEALKELVELLRGENRAAEARRFEGRLARLRALRAEREEIRAQVESGRDLPADLVRLGLAEQGLGELPAARAAYEAALRLDPRRADAQRALQELDKPRPGLAPDGGS
jgi:tetratricopeptide (TPR) repeat protein